MPTCYAVYLTEADRCNPAITICSGRYNSLPEAEAQCAGDVPPDVLPWICAIPDGGSAFCVNVGTGGAYATEAACLAACGSSPPPPPPPAGCCPGGVPGTVTASLSGKLSAIDCATTSTGAVGLSNTLGQTIWTGTYGGAGPVPIQVRVDCVGVESPEWRYRLDYGVVGNSGFFQGTFATAGTLTASGVWSGGPCAGQPISISLTNPCP